MSKLKKKNSFRLAHLWVQIFQILLPVLSSLFVLFMTALGILLASGYSINFKKRTIIKTGVVNIVTRPSGAFIWLNKEPYGKTNKALPNIKVGNYFLELYKDGYYPFKLHIRVEHALATLVHTHLLKQVEPREVQEIASHYFVTPVGIAWVTWETQKDFITTKVEKPDHVVRTGVLHVASVSSNLLGSFKVRQEHYDFNLPYLGKLNKLALRLHPNRSWVILSVDKHLFIGKVAKYIKFREDKYLSSYLAKGATIKFLNTNYVIIIEPSKKVIAYNLESHNKILLYDGTINVGAGICLDVLDNNVLLVVGQKASVMNQEGSVEATYDLQALKIKNRAPINCKLINAGGKPTIALIYSDRLVLIGALFKDSTKRIYTVDTFKRAHDFSIVRLYKEADKDADVVALVVQAKELKDIIPLIERDRLILVDKNKVSLLTFNKEAPDIMSAIGLRILYMGQEISMVKASMRGDYIFAVDKGQFVAISKYGENIYKLDTPVQSFYIDDEGKAVLLIKKVEDKLVLFVKEL